MATAKKTDKTAAQATAEQVVASTTEKVEQASKAAFEGYEQIAALGKENIEAAVTCGTIVAKGYEAIGKEVMAFSKTAFEANMNAAKAIFGAKNVREAFELQGEFTRSSLDQALAESAKISEMSMTVAKQALEPIQARVNATVEKAMKPLAA